MDKQQLYLQRKEPNGGKIVVGGFDRDKSLAFYKEKVDELGEYLKRPLDDHQAQKQRVSKCLGYIDTALYALGHKDFDGGQVLRLAHVRLKIIHHTVVRQLFSVVTSEQADRLIGLYVEAAKTDKEWFSTIE